MAKNVESKTANLGRPQLHRLRLLIVATLVILTVQGWTGDSINLFVPFPTGTVNSFSGFLQALLNTGPFLIYHVSEGILLLVLSFLVLALSLKWSKTRSVRICAALGLLSIISAALGGFLFVFSGFQNDGNSAQMGGSFIGSYAFYFMELYYTK